jgi:hypothetical protein
MSFVADHKSRLSETPRASPDVLRPLPVNVHTGVNATAGEVNAEETPRARRRLPGSSARITRQIEVFARHCRQSQLPLTQTVGFYHRRICNASEVFRFCNFDQGIVGQ